MLNSQDASKIALREQYGQPAHRRRVRTSVRGTYWWRFECGDYSQKNHTNIDWTSLFYTLLLLLDKREYLRFISKYQVN